MGRLPLDRMMQPGRASFHLSLAGAWCRAFRQRIDLARTANSALVPDTFDAQGAAMSTVLAFHLATDHAQRVVEGTSWIGSSPMDPNMLGLLHGRASQFRDAYMHFDDKAEREYVFPPAPPRPPGSLPAPQGAVTMAFGFEEAGAYLYAPVGRSKTRVWTRLSWGEMVDAIDAVESWLLDLIERWQDVEARWAALAEEHNRAFLEGRA